MKNMGDYLTYDKPGVVFTSSPYHVPSIPSAKRIHSQWLPCERFSKELLTGKARQIGYSIYFQVWVINHRHPNVKLYVRREVDSILYRSRIVAHAFCMDLSMVQFRAGNQEVPKATESCIRDLSHEHLTRDVCNQGIRGA